MKNILFYLSLVTTRDFFCFLRRDVLINKAKKIKPVPDWYSEYEQKYLNTQNQKIKKNVNVSLKELDEFYNSNTINKNLKKQKESERKFNKKGESKLSIFIRRSPKERQEYHFEQSKKGSYDYNPKTG